MGPYEELKTACTLQDCILEFGHAQWAARAIEAGESDMRYLVGRFEQACTTIADRVGKWDREYVMTQFRVHAMQRVAS